MVTEKVFNVVYIFFEDLQLLNVKAEFTDKQSRRQWRIGKLK